MAKQRTYKVWKKGERFSTEVEMTTSDRPGRFRMLLAYANAHDLKTIDCDAVWIKEPRGHLIAAI